MNDFLDPLDPEGVEYAAAQRGRRPLPAYYVGLATHNPDAATQFRPTRDATTVFAFDDPAAAGRCLQMAVDRREYGQAFSALVGGGFRPWSSPGLTGRSGAFGHCLRPGGRWAVVAYPAAAQFLPTVRGRRTGRTYRLPTPSRPLFREPAVYLGGRPEADLAADALPAASRVSVEDARAVAAYTFTLSALGAAIV